jgi:hypothetical protein
MVGQFPLFLFTLVSPIIFKHGVGRFTNIERYATDAMLEHDQAQEHEPTVNVWDNIFSLDALTRLQEVGSIRSHSFTSIFDREYYGPRSVLEEAIASILDSVASESTNTGRYVEYWFRDAAKVRMLEAHRDIDETTCSTIQYPIALGSDIKIGKQICPTFGHVLYLSVKGNVIAPTLIWDEEYNPICISGPPREMKGLWSVAAVTNRLLRFRGDALHAVNYPHLSHLKLTKDAEFSYEDKGGAFVKENEQRAVLLFNTWDKEPPLLPPVNEALSNPELEYYKMASTKGKEHFHCRAVFDWNAASIVDRTTDKMEDLVPFNFPLLGGISRRACVNDTIESMVSCKEAAEAFSSSKNVYKIKLY